MSRKLFVFIATSLDGLIAGSNGDLSWLSIVERPGEDYGYHDFINSVDTVIMGRKTYEKARGFGGGFPHEHRKCFVLSRSRSGFDGSVEFYNGDLTSLVHALKQQDGMNIFCDGGAEAIRELVMHDLVDEYCISIVPVLLGSGIPLFKDGRPRQTLELIRTEAFPSGLVQLWYRRRVKK